MRSQQAIPAQGASRRQKSCSVLRSWLSKMKATEKKGLKGALVPRAKALRLFNRPYTPADVWPCKSKDLFVFAIHSITTGSCATSCSRLLLPWPLQYYSLQHCSLCQKKPVVTKCTGQSYPCTCKAGVKGHRRWFASRLGLCPKTTSACSVLPMGKGEQS
eukprot:1160729-Pelagomonas_calceolata.AAC.20